ncbi:baseplate assembly protein [Pasteurellaceae bacterium Macca]|nr:baseplate assembly protein [Pasteurellaceae bacterium Macca]
MPIVDLSKLPAPKILEDVDFETLLAERKAAFLSLVSEEEREKWAFRLELESEPVVKLLQENCYRELLLRSRYNEEAKAVMLAYATDSDLDVIAGNFNVQRKVLRPADPTAIPPIPAVMESDSDLRRRTQLAFEGMSVAGPRSAYLFHAISAHADVADVSVESPQPAHVTVTVLSHQDNGVASAEVLKAVQDAVNADHVRPIADRVTVQSVQLHTYSVQAKLYLYRGPESEPILNTAKARLDKYVKEQHRLGRDITLSALYATLHVEGVQRIVLTEPREDIVLPSHKAGFCSGIQLTTEVADDYQ